MATIMFAAIFQIREAAHTDRNAASNIAPQETAA
jgi:hypothetical protein